MFSLRFGDTGTRAPVPSGVDWSRQLRFSGMSLPPTICVTEGISMKYVGGENVQLFDIADGGDGRVTVVGIADSGEYAPAIRLSETPWQDAGALVVLDDGTLRWRPLPGVPFVLCDRSQGQSTLDSEIFTGLILEHALPAYHGYYVDGQRIQLLDAVRIAEGQVGKIVAVIAEDQYSSGFERNTWSYLKFGFLVESLDGGLEWYKDADEDLELLSRREC